VREETGLTVAPTRVVGVYSSPDFDVVYPNGDQVQQVTVCFECSVTGGRWTVDDDETLELAWLPGRCPPHRALVRGDGRRPGIGAQGVQL